MFEESWNEIEIESKDEDIKFEKLRKLIEERHNDFNKEVGINSKANTKDYDIENINNLNDN
jgi:hypothetical protein